MTFLAHLADRVLNRPLLITPDKASVILQVLSGRIGVDAAEMSRFEGSPTIVDQNGNAKSLPFNVKNGVGIVSIVGSLVNRGAWVGANSGLVSYEGIQQQLKAAQASPEVASVLLDIQSPGGEAIGAFETAAMVRQVATQKRVVAVVNGMAASAGYAIASGASEIVTTETGVSGSIGVVLLHADYSAKLAQDGVKPTLIFAGAHKVDGNPFEPLPDSVRADLQAEVEAFYSAFLNTVAAGRGDRMTAGMARATEARTLIGQKAVDAGLADAVGTFESVLADLSRAPGGRSTSQTRSLSMSEKTGAPAAETSAGISKAELEAAVAKATADATAAAEAKFKADADKAVKADRDRIAALDALAAKAGPGAKEIIAQAKADGSSAETAALKIFDADAHKAGAVLGALEADDATASAAVSAPTAERQAAVEQTKEGWTAEWNGSEKLKAEFDTAADYVAFMKFNKESGK